MRVLMRFYQHQKHNYASLVNYKLSESAREDVIYFRVIDDQVEIMAIVGR